MPINIPNDLPAARVLEDENIFIMNEDRAATQDIRPLKIVILNLMPKKIETETQLLRVLSNTPIQVDIELIQTSSYVSKNTPQEHLTKFYKTFDDIKSQRFDGMIITGAPIELMEFEDVDYWQELCSIMEWSKTNVYSTFHICWGAQAGLYYHFGIPKHELDGKMFGVFEHEVQNPTHRLLRGFDEIFMAPHSRHTTINMSDVENCAQLEVLAYSQQAGLYIAANKNGRQFFVTGHSEYDRETLAGEYFRDKNNGMEIEVPVNYFPDNDTTKTPKYTWRSHGHLLYSNWLNYFVYQETPFDLSNLEKHI